MGVQKKALISRDQVAHVAWLAKIKLTEEELELFARQLNEVLGYFRKIDEVDTRGIEPTYHILDVKNVFRKDSPEFSLPLDKSLQNAPQRERNYVKAPRIL